MPSNYTNTLRNYFFLKLVIKNLYKRRVFYEKIIKNLLDTWNFIKLIPLLNL